MTSKRQQQFVLAMVGGHLLLTAVHGLIHVAIPVFPNGWTGAFAVVSLSLLPLLGAGLVVGGHQRAGAVVLLSAGITSFVFEGAFHFLIPNPDHVAHVTDHHTSFSLTAILTTVGDLFLVGAAWVSVRET